MLTPTMPAPDVAEDAPPAAAAGEVASRHGMRQVLDALVCLAVAVILVRGFLAEGYMISTGSMAPTLPGFHKRVTCPKCRFPFAVGVAPAAGTDEPGSALTSLPRQRASAYQADPGESLSAGNAGPTDEKAVCPNCGQHSIDISSVPRNQGDQLLVHKNAYAFTAPHRWEVIVFRNPARPSQAYVKRIVGLPGETVAVRNGDVTIDGKIERKSFPRQRAMRILVYDHDFEPRDDSGWQPRWVPDPDAGSWERDGTAFVCRKPKQKSLDPDGNGIAWVRYRHWIRSGGYHTTTLPVPPSIPKDVFSNPSLFPLRYDSAKATLSHTGALSASARDRIAKVFDQADFVQLIERLYEESHVARVNDDYGYNRIHRGYRPVPVRDLMFSATVALQGGHGRFAVEMTDGRQRFRFSIDAATREVALAVDGAGRPVRSARLRSEVVDAPLNVEMSLFDRQVLVAINGQQLFKPLLLEAIPTGVPHPRQPIRFGAGNVNLRISALKVYRDVHYTKKGDDSAVKLGDDEFFVLGDNSPISADSRVWKHGGVPRRLLLGKPIFVHLPSRPGNFRIGGTKVQFRIPDFSRIRYIR